MDEALARAAVDFGGRGCLVYRADHLKGRRIGDFDAELAREFFAGFVSTALCNLHLETVYGENRITRWRRCGRPLRAPSCSRAVGSARARVPSTKGTLTA